jgi:hypothetical protein
MDLKVPAGPGGAMLTAVSSDTVAVLRKIIA